MRDLKQETKMSSLEPLKFYRLLPWRGKGSWIKLSGYTLLGYALSHRLNPPLVLLNFLTLGGIFMYGFSLNDYFDFVLEGETNYVGEVVGRRGRGKAILLVLLPLSSLVLLPLFPLPSSLLLFLFFLILTTHSLPPLRMRNRFSGLGYLLLPAGYTLTAAQAHLLLSPLSISHLLFLSLVFLAACQDEMLGLLLRKKEVGKRVEGLALWLSPTLSILSLILLPLSPFFLITTVFSLLKGEGLRRIARRGFHLGEDPLWRRMKPMELSLSTYHLGAYALLGLLGLF